MFFDTQLSTIVHKLFNEIIKGAKMKSSEILKMIIFFLLLVYSFSLPQNVIKQNNVRKNSTIVEADGFAYLSEDKSLRQMREEALINAKREALEKGQTFINSYSKVENFQLIFDFVESKSQGKIRILESKDYGITTNNRYHYWIKAEIEYKINPAPLSKEVLTNPNAPLYVQLWTEKQNYKTGDKINLFLKGNKDFYARIVYVDVLGNILQLIPNQHRSDNFFKGGIVNKVPEDVDGFVLQVGPPYGKEKIILYASGSQQGEIKLNNYGESLFKVDSNIDSLNIKTRAVIIKAKSDSDNNGIEFYETESEITTTN